MKRILIILSAIIMIVAMIGWVVSAFRAPEAVASSAAEPWPAGMGRLDSVLERFPPQEANEAASRLTALGSALPKTGEVDDFVHREIARDELAIGEPPPLPDVSAIRELLLSEPVVWKRTGGIGGGDETQTLRGMQMRMARALIANGLSRARENDPAAWEDLHATWRLVRSLDQHPQMLSQTAALSMTRMINAVAWKMPLPAPAWFGQLQERDLVQPLLESFQYQSASYWADGMRLFPTKALASSVEHDRRIAGELLSVTSCDVNARMNELGTDLSSVWRRAFRYRAEREATANALRLREGEPIQTTSRCSDGEWTFDGTTLRFSREIATAAPDTPMPLTLRVSPSAGEPR